MRAFGYATAEHSFDAILSRGNGFIALLDITHAENYIRDA